ncbi:ion transporter [Gemmobacter straminiformis]|uniref:Ion transporter n=2 Tax=Paragemmobacter straminiformis TaxID=2045119 RepID=A0A842I458_9RHOB|nr:potassium channel family protein [Gemmobacter straminiformis]MBC2834213.1 ion transporter [Gemmobacter straminiformis]
MRFRYALLVFDLLTVAFVVATSFIARAPWVEAVDVLLGIAIGLEFGLRIWVVRDRKSEIFSLAGIADIVVIASLLAPLAGEGLAFLRVARVFRLTRSYAMLNRLRQDSRFFRRNEQSVLAGLNLAVFVFVVTAVVYETQVGRNGDVTNYADALYFTVTTLTTTGFGDITLTGTDGRLLSVLVMIFGVSLFIRLIQVLVRPPKVDHKCPTCGLRRHDFDAVHCKACGTVLNIEDEGAV